MRVKFGKTAIDRASSKEIYKILSVYAQKELQQCAPDQISKDIQRPSDMTSQMNPTSASTRALRDISLTGLLLIYLDLI